MKILKIFIIFLSFLSTKNLYSQEGFPLNGVEDSRDNHYAFINAKIIVDYKTSIDNGTLIIKNGQIVSVGQNILIPKGLRAFDLEGKYIYPSFIDVYSDYGIIKKRKSISTNSSSNWTSSYTNPKILSAKDGPFGWNESVNSEFNSVENIKIDNKKSNLMRNLMFASEMIPMARAFKSAKKIGKLIKGYHWSLSLLESNKIIIFLSSMNLNE